MCVPCTILLLQVLFAQMPTEFGDQRTITNVVLLAQKGGKKVALKGTNISFLPFLSLNLSWIFLFDIEYCIPFSIYKCLWGHCWAKRNADPHYSALVLPSSCWVMSSDWTGWTSLKLVKSSRESLSICGLWSISMSRNKSIGFNNSISVK